MTGQRSYRSCQKKVTVQWFSRGLKATRFDLRLPWFCAKVNIMKFSKLSFIMYWPKCVSDYNSTSMKQQIENRDLFWSFQKFNLNDEEAVLIFFCRQSEKENVPFCFCVNKQSLQSLMEFIEHELQVLISGSKMVIIEQTYSRVTNLLNFGHTNGVVRCDYSQCIESFLVNARVALSISS